MKPFARLRRMLERGELRPGPKARRLRPDPGPTPPEEVAMWMAAHERAIERYRWAFEQLAKG